MIHPKSLYNFLTEARESQAAQQAKEMGLQSTGYGNWADPRTGQVTHRTVKGQLVPVAAKDGGDPQQAAQEPEAPQEPVQVQEPDPEEVERMAKGLASGRWSVATPKRKKQLTDIAYQRLSQQNQQTAAADAEQAAAAEMAAAEAEQAAADAEMQRQQTAQDMEMKSQEMELRKQEIERGKIELQQQKEAIKQQKQAEKEAAEQERIAAEQEAAAQAEQEAMAQQAAMEAPAPKPRKRKVSDIQKRYKEQNEDQPEGLDDLLKSIRGEPVSSVEKTLAQAKKAAKTQNEIDNTDYELDAVQQEALDLNAMSSMGTYEGNFDEDLNKLIEQMGVLTERQRKNVDKKFGKIRNQLKNITDETSRNNMKQAISLATTYTGRVNSGAGKNALGLVDYETLKANTPRLVAGYGDGSPEKVKEFVESTRIYEPTDEEVDVFYDLLPDKVKKGFNKAGSIGPSYAGHFLGYNEDGTEKRGKVTASTSERGKIVARLLLAQGLKDAYTGLPLDLNKVDLEHVVGFNNSDNGKPTRQDWANRENINNFVLTASNVNQLKADKNMQDFITTEVDKLDNFAEEDFQTRDDLLDRSNDINSSGALLSQLFALDDAKQKDLDQAFSADASFENFDMYASKDRQMTKDINKEMNKFARGKGVNLSNVKNRMGYETMKRLGLGSYIPKAPTLDNKGNIVKEGRGNQSKFDDKVYVAFLSSVLNRQPEMRAGGRQAWDDARQAAVDAMNQSGNNGDGKKALVGSLIQNGWIDQRFLEDKEFKRILKEDCNFDYSLYLAEQRLSK